MHIETARSHQTLANLSHLPDEAIAALRLVLGGKTVVDADAALQVQRSAGHGHVAAVHTIARQLGLPGLLGPACRERDLAYALLVSRVVRPRSKLSTIGWWDDVTLGADLGVAGASTDEVYQAMDWLVDRQDHIEAELARRHLAAGGIAMFDLSSSWMEGSHCELACFGYSRDGKRGKPQIEYGLLCDPAGRPVAVRVFAGNTADPTAFTQAVEVVRGSFDLRRLILVGDRGMITSARIGDLRATPAWPGSPRCAPPRSSSWPKTAARCSLACSTSRTWPRSPARTTPASGWWPAVTRCWPQSVPASEGTCWPPPRPCWPRSSSRWMPGGSRTPTRSVSRPTGHCASTRSASTLWSRSPRGRLSWHRDQAKIDAEAALDGIYVIRTSVPAATLDAPGAVAAYKNLALVERDFRHIKADDLDLRPIWHRLADRVRGHVLLCMLACYLVWHLRGAWAPLTFTDEHPPAREDPVAPARRSPAAQAKASRKANADHQPVRGFRDLLDHLATLTRDTITISGRTVDKLTTPTPLQRRAFDLLNTPIPITLT